jgi:hypothetical protein
MSSCDDGDIINVNLDFSEDLSLCQNLTSDFLLFTIKTDPAASLSLLMSRNATTEAFFTTATDPDNPTTFTLGSNGSSFNYRTYNITPTFCNQISDSDLVVLEDYEASNSATVTVVTTIVDNDNDGIPTIDEDENPDGDNNPASNPTDTDGDGIPNYLDQDDDNDNVLTKDEDDDNDGDGNPFTNARDTDGNGVPDYLDPDDDGDDVPTRLEDENGNQNLTDDFLDDLPGETPRFLNPAATDIYTDFGFRDTQFTRTFRTRFTIQNLGIEIINTDFLDFGTYTRTETFTYDN